MMKSALYTSKSLNLCSEFVFSFKTDLFSVRNFEFNDYVPTASIMRGNITRGFFL